MKFIWLRLMPIILALLFSGCASRYSVSTDYNTDYDFTDRTRFALVEPAHIKTVSNPLIAERVAEAIRDTLVARGFRETHPEQADIHISYLTTREESQDTRIFENYNSYYRYEDCYQCVPDPLRHTSDVVTVNYVEGQLMIDVIDPGTNMLKWRGRTTARFKASQVSRMNPEEITARVRAAVEAVLAEYPPPQQ